MLYSYSFDPQGGLEDEYTLKMAPHNSFKYNLPGEGGGNFLSAQFLRSCRSRV